VVHGGKAQLRQTLGQDGGEGCNTLCDALQALRPVVDRIHAGHDGGQHLRGADVGGGFFAADVLLARLQRQTVSGLAMHVHAHAHQTAGHAALELIAAGHEGGVRAARTHGHAKALRGADDDVGTPLAGWREQCKGQKVGGEDGGGLLGMDGFYIGLPVHDPAAAGGVLDEGCKKIACQCRFPLLRRVHYHHGDSDGSGAGLDHLDGLRMRVAGDDEGAALGLDRAHGQRHRLGGSRGLVEHGGVGNRHAGEVAHHGLEVDQRLHAALRNFGLVGRVGRVPGGVLQDVAQDHAGRVRAVVALADEALEQLVLGGDCLELGQRGVLGGRGRQVHGLAARDGARHDAVDEGAARGLADHRQHVRFVGRVDADVAGQELGGVFECGQGQGGGHLHGGTSLECY
jgi:hypothetical protein